MAARWRRSKGHLRPWASLTRGRGRHSSLGSDSLPRLQPKTVELPIPRSGEALLQGEPPAVRAMNLISEGSPHHRPCCRLGVATP